MSLDLLCLAPHPDDAELSCGGWLAKAAASGQAVGVVDLTRGELATNGTPELRAEEAAAAAGILGLVHRDNLGLPDGGLRADDDAQLRAVVGVIRALQPQLILAPWVEARHPDHAACGALARRAVFFAGLGKFAPELGERHRPLRLLHYPQRHEVRPDFVVDITAHATVKRQAVAAHISQVGPGVETLVNAPLGTAAWEVRDRYWGASIGVEHAEPYVLGGPVPIDDPLAHFAAHPATPVLVPR